MLCGHKMTALRLGLFVPKESSNNALGAMQASERQEGGAWCAAGFVIKAQNRPVRRSTAPGALERRLRRLTKDESAASERLHSPT